MILAAMTHAAPYGGAVRLSLLSTEPEDESVLVLATASDTAPDPTAPDDEARVVHAGRPHSQAAGAYIQTSLDADIRDKVQGAYTVLDLDTQSLPDDEAVFYHVYSRLEGETYSQPLTVVGTPRCTRVASVRLVRDLVKGRLEYHLERGIRDGALPSSFGTMPILEQETLEEGFDLPALLIKERSTPNPSAETIGHGVTTWRDVFDGMHRREYIHETNVRIDVLVMTQSPEVRAKLESYVHGCCLIDHDYYLAAGLENVEIMRHTRHDLDPGALHYYAVELAITGKWSLRVTEEMGSAVIKDIYP